MAVLEKPVRVLFCEPNNIILQDGILVNATSPPATPINLAATEAPEKNVWNLQYYLKLLTLWLCG